MGMLLTINIVPHTCHSQVESCCNLTSLNCSSLNCSFIEWTPRNSWKANAIRHFILKSSHVYTCMYMLHCFEVENFLRALNNCMTCYTKTVFIIELRDMCMQKHAKVTKKGLRQVLLIGFEKHTCLSDIDLWLLSQWCKPKTCIIHI